MSNKLEQLYQDATPGPWYVSVKISESICTKDELGYDKRIADLVAIPRKATTRPGQTKYSQIENARLIATLYNIGPHVIALMAAVETSKNLPALKALRALKEAIDAQPAVQTIDVSWKQAEQAEITKSALAPAVALKDANLTKSERRKLRRQLRKQRREAGGSTD